MRLVVIIIFVLGGAGLAYWNFYRFPWPEQPSRKKYWATLLVYLTIGGSIGFLAGGWLAGRLP